MCVVGSRKHVRGAQWPSGRVADSGGRGLGSIPTSALLYPFTPRKVLVIQRKLWLYPDMTEKLLTGM